MKKIFKFSIFKKTLITIMIGLIVVLNSFVYMNFQTEKDTTIDDYFESFKEDYAIKEIQNIFDEYLDNPEIEFDKAIDLLNGEEFDNQFSAMTEPRYHDDIIITYWMEDEKVSSIYPDKYVVKTTYDYKFDFIELEGKKYSLEMLSYLEKESLLNYFKNNVGNTDEEDIPLKKFEYCIKDNQICYLKWENQEYGYKTSGIKEEYVGAEFFLLEHCVRNEIGSGNIVVLNKKDIEKAIQSVHFAFTSGVSGREVVEIDDKTFFILGRYIAGDTHDKDNRIVNVFSVEVATNLNKDVFKWSIDKYIHIYVYSFILMIFLSWILATILVYPINKLEKAALKIANNEFDEEVKVKSNDEIGSLANSIDIMRVKLKETIESLNTEIEKVKELESLRKDFINQFTHEMKTPLGIINGYSELLEETENEEERQRYLDIINKETVRINDLVQGMLRLSRLEAGKVELNKEVLDLEDIVTEVVDEFEILLMKKNIRIEVNVVDKEITGDKQQIITVLRNFISNAIKHTDSKIVVTVDKGVRVYNEGQPIEQDKLEGIWYTFVTHDKTGTGLGLAICRSILELHNYSYGVTNKDNGVEFYFEVQEI